MATKPKINRFKSSLNNNNNKTEEIHVSDWCQEADQISLTQGAVSFYEGVSEIDNRHYDLDNWPYDLGTGH